MEKKNYEFKPADSNEISNERGLMRVIFWAFSAILLYQYFLAGVRLSFAQGVYTTAFVALLYYVGYHRPSKKQGRHLSRFELVTEQTHLAAFAILAILAIVMLVLPLFGRI